MPHRLSGVASEIEYYLAALFASAFWKTLIALFLLPFQFAIGDNMSGFYVWLALSVIDAVEGSLLAIRDGVFRRSRLYGWVIKFGTHSGCILIVGAMRMMITDIFGYSPPLVELLILLMALTEAASVLDSAKKLGLPVPEPVMWLVTFLRHKMRGKMQEMADSIGGSPPEKPESKIEGSKVEEADDGNSGNS